ncbi:MAG TPA: bifunctional 2-polyprenyl-6-hydroxyphenol methylase/3-demethylubiquinol 3-O-methyltransferase UbiG [Sphingomicrobium sp.]|jgi:2-polyprenyl-6-hydroxyphenyl methylase / 3-demethylubiquinone-9 3-methyltransferase|nr:bifunctional 2-polyprenyl-6-hydroxyphenol methylase/3-demethylubiquinol 3-O-methyltransferase UbiG [Sphingomicrobium sp.]
MSAQTSVVPEEIAQFTAQAGRWWDPDGPEAMLHKLNPVRLAYVRDRIDQHWQCDEHGFRPLDGKTALDVGCGAGLLAEPVARLSARVTAIDAAAELIDVARAHAAGQGLAIDYRHAAVEDIDGRFDLVTCMEVVEHVADPRAFVAALAARLAPGGLLVLSTPNRTAWSKLLMVTIAEGIGQIPKGTHDFAKFITPDEMKAMLAAAGLAVIDCEGIAYSPTRGLHLSEDMSLNYLIAAAWPKA